MGLRAGSRGHHAGCRRGGGSIRRRAVPPYPARVRSVGGRRCRRHRLARIRYEDLRSDGPAVTAAGPGTSDPSGARARRRRRHCRARDAAHPAGAGRGGVSSEERGRGAPRPAAVLVARPLARPDAGSGRMPRIGAPDLPRRDRARRPRRARSLRRSRQGVSFGRTGRSRYDNEQTSLIALPPTVVSKLHYRGLAPP